MKSKELEELKANLSKANVETTKEDNNELANSTTGYIKSDSSRVPVKGKYPKTNKLFNSKWMEIVPEHVKNMVYLIRNNTEIRRYTALGIINYLSQKGEIKGDKKYVDFMWNKFCVVCDGIKREYHYTEVFFINALVASFTSFSASAQKAINEFCEKEMNGNISDVAEKEEIDSIVENNSHN